MRARRITHGTTWLLTRRCSDRRFFLRPSRKTNEIFRYVVGQAAEEYGVAVHVATVMSNHYHLVVTDPNAELPDFMRMVNRELAKAVGAEIGRWGGFFEPGTYSAVELVDNEAVIAKSIYTLANPVLAGLVRRVRAWPGVSSLRWQFGVPQRIRRPNTKYYRRSRQPPQVMLTFEPPPGIDALTFRDALLDGVRNVEREMKQTLRKGGRKVIGPNRVQAQDPYDSPTTWAKRRGLNPRVATTDKWKRIEALQRNRAWLDRYEEALKKFCAGVRDVLFPYGTFKMPRIYGCLCEPPPAPA